MKIDFKVAKYVMVDGRFNHDGYDEYVITFKRGLRPHQLRIVVNGFLSSRVINMADGNSGYKDQILLAIKDFKNGPVNKHNLITKPITLTYIQSIYSKKFMTNIKNYLLNINKEESRDKLTEFGLIDN
jgi:hypothetical protein